MKSLLIFTLVFVFAHLIWDISLLAASGLGLLVVAVLRRERKPPRQSLEGKLREDAKQYGVKLYWGKKFVDAYLVKIYQYIENQSLPATLTLDLDLKKSLWSTLRQSRNQGEFRRITRWLAEALESGTAPSRSPSPELYQSWLLWRQNQADWQASRKLAGVV